MSIFRLALVSPRLLIALFATLLCTTTSLSTAQAQDQDPGSILDASREALAEIDGFSAQFRMRGEGGSMFADTLPSMNGMLYYGTHSTYGRVIHCIGESKDTQKSPSQSIDILIATDRYLWTDLRAQTINERPITKSTRGIPSAISVMLMDSIIDSDPFANDVANAETIDLLDQETIAGTLCDVVHIKRSKPESRTQAANDSYTDARWFIGAEDRLPRKVEHITDAGLVKITLLFEFGSINLHKPNDQQLDVSRPDGFEFKSTMPTSKPKQPGTQTRTAPNTQNQTPNVPAVATIKRAPQYAFTPVDSSEINNTTQDGRITVLYFWGSWCVPCATSSPLFSSLAEEFSLPTDRPVDLFGLAIRELDHSQTKSGFVNKGYHHRLVLGADDLVSSFRVRLFPTIIVINAKGQISAQLSISKERSAEQLVEQTKAAIQKAID